MIALFIVYTVMVIQFERFIQPLIVMISVPFCIIGITLGLPFFGSHISMIAFLGMITLAGIVVNNAIVLIDYINLLRKERKITLKKAVITGAGKRLKPILMTTLTTIFGIVPLAIGAGEGAELYAPLGQAIVTGLGTSTLITLIIIPIFYMLIERKK